jgi:hypothetical protein
VNGESMKVIVTNCRNPILEQELVSAAKFYTKQLLSKQLYKHIFLEIIVKNNMEDLGNCCITFYNDWYKPREFEVELKTTKSLKKTLLTLAHEIVHLKQFAKGELNNATDKWYGERIRVDTIAYYDLPWEVEATSLEYILYGMYKDYRKNILKET